MTMKYRLQEFRIKKANIIITTGTAEASDNRNGNREAAEKL